MTSLAVPTPRPYLPNSGDTRFCVLHTVLTIDYRPRTNHLEGTALMTVRVLEPTKSLRFDLVGLRAGKVRVDGVPHAHIAQDAHALTLRFKAPVPAGTTLRISVAYAGKPGPRTTRWGGDRLGGTRQWGPCRVAADRCAELVPLQRPGGRSRKLRGDVQLRP